MKKKWNIARLRIRSWSGAFHTWWLLPLTGWSEWRMWTVRVTYFINVQIFFLCYQTWGERTCGEHIIILNSGPHSEQDVVLLTPNYFSLFPSVTHWMNFCSPLGSCQFSRHSIGTSGQNVSSPFQWRVLLRLGPASNYLKGIIKVSFSIKAPHTAL